MDKLLVIIPAHNEAENLPAVLCELQADLPQADIVVVDDASTDDTAAVAAPHANVLRMPFNMGYAGALQAGFKYAAAHEYSHVLQFDGDGQHIAGEGGKLLQYAQAHHADIVIGTRFWQGSDYPHPMMRRLGTKLFTWLIRLVCKRTVSDPTSGFQVLSRRVFIRYAALDGYPSYPDANLIIEMLREGYAIAEQPVHMRKRQSGSGMHDGIWKPARYMVLMLYAVLLVSLRPLRRKKGE